MIQGENYGEGITFFLSPNGSNIPPDSGSGRSVVSQYWENDISDGIPNEAQIKYDSSTKNLSVTYFKNGGAVFKNLDFLVDLRAHLPEYVTFGFSGSTGSSYEKNSIQKFSTARLRIDEGEKEAAKEGVG
ncbi:hypothetical protein C3L33_21079, partial [Rhododendron williamsianum]